MYIMHIKHIYKCLFLIKVDIGTFFLKLVIKKIFNLLVFNVA